MQHFTIPCDVGGQRISFAIYVGEPDPDAHPLQHQAAWLRRERDAIVPEPVMESFAKLQEIALENDVSFEDLVVYAMGAGANEDDDTGADTPSDDTDSNTG